MMGFIEFITLDDVCGSVIGTNHFHRSDGQLIPVDFQE